MRRTVAMRTGVPTLNAIGRKSRKVPRLTPEQQAAAVDALEHGLRVSARYERAYGDYDFAGEVGLRIVRYIREFDAAGSSLKTWARNQADYACRDVVRFQVYDREKGGRAAPRALSLEGCARRDRHAKRPASLAESLIDDDAAAVGSGIEAGEASHALCRGLSDLERDAVYGSIVEDRRLWMIGRERRLCESRLSLVRTNALKFLREARARDYPGWARTADAAGGAS